MTISVSAIIIWSLVSGFIGALLFYFLFKLVLSKWDESYQSGIDGVVLGIIERIFFVFSTCFGYPSFPLLWVGLKVGVQSSSWTKGANRKLLNVYLIMNLFSVAIGYLCAWAVFDFAEPGKVLAYFKAVTK